MSKNHIFRIEKDKNYTTMSNYHLNDNNLSWKAKGLHSYILSKPDDWKVIVGELVNASTDGKTSTRNAINELYENRYWQKYPVYIDGLIDHWETIVYEKPFEANQKIKNIKYIEDKMILNFEESEEIEETEGVKKNNPQTQQIQLLTENLKVGFQEVENGTLLNTNNTNNLNILNTNKKDIYNTIFLSPENNEGLNLVVDNFKDEINKEDIKKPKEFNQILENSNYKDFEDKYISAILQAIRLLYYSDKSLRINNMLIPPSQVREDLKMLRWNHIDFALRDFKIQSKNQEIQYPIGYLSRCIYNAIFQGELRKESELLYHDLL